MSQTQKVVFIIRLDHGVEITKSVEVTHETTEQLQGTIGQFLGQFCTIGVTQPVDKDNYQHYPAKRVQQIDVTLPRVTLATALPRQTNGIVV